MTKYIPLTPTEILHIHLSHFIKVMHIEFDASWFHPLVQIGRLKNIADLYRLTRNDLLGLENINPLQVDLFFESIEKSKITALYTFLDSLNFLNFYQIKELEHRFKSIDGMFSMTGSDLGRIGSITCLLSGNVLDAFHKLRPLIDDLRQYIQVLPQPTTDIFNGLSFFCNTNAVFLPIAIEQHGGTIRRMRILGKEPLVYFDYFIGDHNRQRSQILKNFIQENQIKIINSNEFWQMLEEKLKEYGDQKNIDITPFTKWIGASLKHFIETQMQT